MATKRGQAGWLVAAMVICAALCGAVVAAETTASGTGHIRATGDGTIQVKGNGNCTYQLNGTGTLTVYRKDDVTVDANGNGTRSIDGGALILKGWKGRVKVSGKNIACSFTRGHVVFSATGTGKVYLKGTGRYWKGGHRSVAWSTNGTTLTLGTSGDADSSDDGADADDYLAQSKAVVGDITASDGYADWKETYPAAAQYLETTGNLAAFIEKYPKAADALQHDTRFKAWLKKHSKVARALSVHGDYAQWIKDHPWTKRYFKNHVQWHAWLLAHPKAAQAIRERKVKEWAAFEAAHPEAAAALKAHDAAVKDRLDLNDDGKVDLKEHKAAWKDRADQNDDGKVDAKERALDANKRKTRFHHMDYNNDGHVSPSERARYLRQQRQKKAAGNN